jgi:hypothetical protein
LFRRGRQSRCLVVRETLDSPPEELYERLRDVEAEPALVPGVSSVAVLARGEAWVRYRVEGRTWGMPWWAVFRKEWERGPQAITWESEGGSFELRQVGQLELANAGTDTSVTLVACTRFDLPVIGPLATLTSGPLYLQPAFRTWLRNAAVATAARRRWEQLLGETVTAPDER